MSDLFILGINFHLSCFFSDLQFDDLANVLKLFLGGHFSVILIFLDIFGDGNGLPFLSHGFEAVSSHQVKLLHEEVGLLTLELVEVLDYLFEGGDALHPVFVILDFLHFLVEELHHVRLLDISPD
jgi:hypothetical protein